MCGIGGIVYRETSRPVDAGLLKVMMDELRHRGPDAEGSFLAPGIGLGVRRLSIIDLETGDQPQSNEDGTIHVVCNGEIYNYVELRENLVSAGHRFRTHSDTEVIVHLYEDLGMELVNRLRGMFAFAVWDERSRRLLLARDRLGIKPLYYAETSDGLYFASEQKALLKADGIARDIDPEALETLFALGFVVAPTTLFRSIRQLPAGHVLSFFEGRMTVREYWDMQFPARDEAACGKSGEGWADALRAKLEETVRIHLRSDVPVGAWLSGGLDSSAVVALMAKQLERPIHASSLSFESRTRDEIHTQRTLLDFPEYRVAPHVTVCTRGDFERFPEALWYFEDPTTSGLEIVRMLISEAIAGDVKVVMTGEGADETFGGYPWFRSNKLLRPFSHLPLPLRYAARAGPLVWKRLERASRLVIAEPEMNAARYRISIGRISDGAAERLLSPELRRSLPDSEEFSWEPNVPRRFSRWHPFNQLMYYEIKVRLPSFVLPVVDRGSMAKSLEARVPFLDHELVELTAQIPPRLKLKRLREKYILRRAIGDLIPREIVARRKRGLAAPVGEWIRDPIPEFAADLLSPSALRRTGYFRPEGVARTLEEHRGGARDRAGDLLGVLAVQLWDELFVKRSGGPRGRD